MAVVYELAGILRGRSAESPNPVWIRDGRICGLAPRPDEIVERVGGFIYPGLLDVHTHLGMTHAPTPPSDAEILRRLVVCRSLGVLAIRDAGSQRNPNEVRAVGLPKVIHCGRHIARPKRYTRYLGVEVEPEQLLEQVRRECLASDGWIKIVGDWIDRERGDLAPLWEAELFARAVALAHSLSTKVTVHSFAAQTVDMLLDAGVDGIEHGTGMNRAQLERARDLGVLITPTVNQISRFPEFAAAGYRFPHYQQHMLRMDAQRAEHLRLMEEVGTHFLMGSDTTSDVSKRGLPRELVDAVHNGLSAKTVMEAASWRGRAALGFSNWEEGAPADFVVYDADPERDISAVLEPARVFVDGQSFTGGRLDED